MHLVQATNVFVENCLVSCEAASFCVSLCSRQSCARVCCGASLRRSHCVSTALRCSLSRPHRGTHFAHCVRAVRTTAMRMMTKCASRTAVKAPLLSVEEGAPQPTRAQLCGSVVGGRHEPPTTTAPKAEFWCASLKLFFNERALVFAAAHTNATSSRQAVSGGGDLWGAEQRSSEVGARSALREHARCGCPNGESEANAVSSAARPLREQRRGVGACPRPPRCEPPPDTACRDARAYARNSFPTSAVMSRKLSDTARRALA